MPLHPTNHEDWARHLAVLLDSALMAADPESIDTDFNLHREALDRYSFWRAEKSGQLSMPIAAHGCHCHEEETE
jgi:hypothetical protein